MQNEVCKPDPAGGVQRKADGPAVRILCVDDSADMHELYQKIFISDEAEARRKARIGEESADAPLPAFQLDNATQGQQALEMVIQARKDGRPYAVAFVDMRMPPGWDGIQTIEEIWAVDPGIEVVICTAFVDYSADDIVRRMRRTDQLLLLKKPFDNIEVRLLAFALAEKWRLSRQAESYFDNLEAIIKERTGELEQSVLQIGASENQDPIAL